jgi:hypothetical protein
MRRYLVQLRAIVPTLTPSPPSMPVLKTLVETGTKARFRSIAKARGLSESELLRAAVLTVTGEDTGTKQPIEPDAEKADTARMTVRMPRFLMDGTRARAKGKGMAPSRWVAALVQSNLTRQPVTCDEELAGLLASNRELAAIGRNLNQIARALNEAFYETERVKLEKLAELRQVITENRLAIRALVRASQNAWEADDGID